MYVYLLTVFLCTAHYRFLFSTQDPNTIEHETAASGDTYAVVDKPKRSSKRKGAPDVVPPPSEV